MDIETLKIRLQRYISADDRLALPDKNDLESQVLSQLIHDYFPADPQSHQPTFAMTISEQPPHDDKIVLIGTGAVFAQDTAAYHVEAVFTVPDQVAQLVVTVSQLPADWTFANSFAGLTNTVFDRFVFKNPTFRFASVADTAVLLAAPGLFFSSGLVAAGPLTSVAWLLPDLNSMVLAGQMTFVDNVPQMQLVAPGTSPVQLGPLTISMNVTLASSYLPAGTTNFLYTAAQLTAVIAIPDGAKTLEIPVTMTVTSERPSLLTLTVGDGDYPISNFNVLSALDKDTNFGTLVPTELPRWDGLSISGITLVIAPYTQTLVSIGVTVKFIGNQPWTLIKPDTLKITNLGIDFTVLLATNRPSVLARIFGQFAIGSSFRYDVDLRVPELVLSGALAPGSTVALGPIVQQFLEPITGPISDLPSFTVFEFDLYADFRSNTYSLTAGISDLWNLPLPLFPIKLEVVTLVIAYSNRSISGVFQAILALDVTPPTLADKRSVEFAVTVEKLAGSGGWNFSIGMVPGESLDLLDLLRKFLATDFSMPDFLPQTLRVAGLEFSINSRKWEYSIAGATDGPWTLALSDQIKVGIAAAITVESTVEQASATPFTLVTSDQVWLHALPAPRSALAIVAPEPALAAGTQRVYSGTIAGEFTLNDFKLAVTYTFNKDNHTLQFLFAYKRLQITCTYIKEQSLLKVNLGDLSLGEILEFLVNLADPAANFQLTSPWTFLNDINFKNLVLTIDLAKKSVGIEYQLDREFVIVHITTIGLEYTKSNGKGSVRFKIGGKFIDQTYDYDKNPLSWDALKDAPPVVPGKGPKLIQLYYLGMGQHIALQQPKDTISEVIEQFKTAAKPVSDPAQGLPPGLAFSAESQWLIGAQFVILETVTLGVLFNDPNLYGLLVTLGGPKAEKFSGLSFEILYKRVADNIGVYHIELRLPDAMRQLEFGAVSVTLPIVTVDIYTNGNFRIDFGFPHGLDFSRSFSLQVTIFSGYGGFYFALLTGATAKRLPQISNGTFSPVISFGLALSLGLGRSFQRGVLSAELSVTVVGVFEGVIAWFNPNNAAVKSDRYYWIQATLGIVGKLSGAIDFGVIAASVTVMIYASATLTIEAYAPLILNVRAGVKVEVSLKILFITVHFSFSMEVEETFHLGDGGTPPWLVQPAFSARQRSRLFAGQRLLRAQRPFTSFHSDVAARLRTRIARADPVLDWTPPAFGSNTTIDLTLLPAFSVAAPQYLYPSAQPEGLPGIQAVMQLFVQNSIPTSARTAEQVRQVTASNADQHGFNLLVDGVLRWSIYALLKRDTGSVTTQNLGDILQWLAVPENADSAFSYANLDTFLKKNYTLRISGPPPNMTSSESPSGTPFPMIPMLSYTPPGGEEIDFNTHIVIPTVYKAKVAAYFEQLRTGPEQYVSALHHRGQPTHQAVRRAYIHNKAAINDGDESLATFVFKDYFALLAKSVLQNALKLLSAYSYKPMPNQQLADIATLFSVSAERIVVANQDRPILRDKASFKLADVLYQVRSEDTFRTLGTLFPGLTTNDVLAANEQAAILFPQAQLKLNHIVYVVQPGDTIEFIAAFLLVRNGLQVIDIDLGWMLQSIVDLNPRVFNPTNQGSGSSIPPGLSLTIPVVNRLPQTVVYHSRENDTVAGIAATFILYQKGLTDPSFVAALKAKYPTITPGQQLAIPPLVHTVTASDSLKSICEGMYVAFGSLVVDNVDAAGLLAPKAVLAIPPFSCTVTSATTLANIANTFNLSIADLTAAIEHSTDLLSGASLTIPQAQQIAIDDLRRSMLDQGLYNNVAATVARFLLHGLRLPDPYNSEFERLTVDELLRGDQVFDLFGLNDMIGQQFGVSGTSVDLTFENKQAIPWITFATGPTGPNSSTLTIKLDDISKDLPSTTFHPHSTAKIQPYTLQVPNRYGMQQMMHWQASEAPLFVGATGATGSQPLVGEPTIWPLSDTLRARVTGQTGAPQRYSVLRWAGDSSTTQPVPLARYDWATLIEIRVQRVRANAVRPQQADQLDQVLRSELSGSAAMPNTYLMLGADQAGREQLHQIWQQLNTSLGVSAQTLLYFLYAPSQADANSAGLTSDKLNRQHSSLLKTNLSTLTHSGPQRAMAFAPAPSSGEYFANLESQASADFIRLLWECSIVGTGGYYFNYYNQPSGTGLPAYLFDENNQASLWLLVYQPYEQHQLFAFNNCAVVGDNLDASVSTLFAQRNDDYAYVPAMAPGHIAFEVVRPDPTATKHPDGPVGALSGTPTPLFVDPITPDQLTQQLYNLSSYQVTEPTTRRPISRQGLPAGPTSYNDATSGALSLPQHLRGDPSQWRFQQLIPIHRLINDTAVPDCAALPAPQHDPYNGIAQQRQLELDFDFHDIFGNRTMPTLASGETTSLAVTLGYYDDIVPFLQWPGIGSFYTCAPVEQQPALQLNARLQLANYLPAGGMPLEQLQDRASADIVKYQQIYYQVMQRDLTFSMRTSLDSHSSQTPYVLSDKRIFTRFVGAAYIFLTSLLHLRAVSYATAADQSQTLGEVADTLGVAAATLLQSNATLPASHLFADGITLPAYTLFRHGDTLAAIATHRQVALDTLADYNQLLALRPGAIIATVARTYNVPSKVRLDQIAAGEQCSVSGLAAANATRTGIFTDQALVRLQGVTITATTKDSFVSLCVQFNSALTQNLQAVTVEDIAVANQTTTGLLAENAQIHITDLVIGTHDSLNSLSRHGSYGDLPTLVALNSGLADLYAAGTPLVYQLATATTDDTLAELIATRQITYAQLAEHNRDASLKRSATPVVPDLARIDTTQPCFVPAITPADATWSEIANAFDGTPSKLAELNQAMDGLFVTGATIKLPGKSYTVQANDTFASLFAVFKGINGINSLADFVDRVQAMPDLINGGSLIAGPVPRETTPQNLADLAATYGTTPEDLALVNRATHQFVAPGTSVTLTVDQGGQQRNYSVTTGLYDTFNTLVYRFAQQGVTTSIEAIAQQNADRPGLVSNNARYILPPPPVVTEVPVQPAYPRALFEVTVDLLLRRDQALVVPEARKDSNVAQAMSSIVPRTDATNEAIHSLRTFAGAFEATFPGLKLATGKQISESGGTSTAPQLWAVNFGDNGIHVAAGRQPASFFALKPLSNQLMSRNGVLVQSHGGGRDQ